MLPTVAHHFDYSLTGFGNSPENQKRRSMFSTGAHMHLIHSAALLGLSGCSRPKLSASLFILGVGLFSGTCYYTALTDDYRFVKIAPIGGTVLIIAWLSLLL
uniref:Transmembrane protein 256 homolog n=1 Tax=Schistocephalus solidus TaxID=70667 RepID=A0A0V0JB41_SCHSO